MKAETAAPVKLTPARRKALLVLADRHQQTGHLARVSDVTDATNGHVHWQAVRWLRGAGLVQGISDGCGGESHVYVRITQAGLDHLAAEATTNGGR